ncbi:MAG: signal peptidase II [Phycisphaeraceae bacterium]|nr:signal peptidase II [Phycisphaeraceae bacterium]MCB9848364.1 signal peptidase II [Phycisphaeraceae bacterium]
MTAQPRHRPAPHAGPARDPRAWALLLGVTALGVAFDLVSKSVAFARIAGHPVAVRREEVLALPPSEIGALIPRHIPVGFIPRVLEFQLVINPGAIFGVGAGRRWFFVLFTSIALAFGVWVFAKWTGRRDRIAHAALGLIFAGGLGNLYDRLVFGCVRDFLHPAPGVNLPFGWSWPGGAGNELWPWVSNVADALLLIGVALLMLRLWKTPAHAHPAAPAIEPDADP